ncbi:MULTISPECIES: ribonuclease T2 [unclassified Salipiger]|uniref:ribonuclease T2 family protein n=1 Tax=unclassified Salipiger TaxID=2640570 RepID=UPI0013B5B670|nr:MULTISPECIES: ribonuclease T2 [unclassified Salipiger]NDV48626.1 ribonuclease T2 [Salipiger sp. PrR003]NDW30714.1 ribonuclease T2 [Salipiger sp. PrR007]
MRWLLILLVSVTCATTARAEGDRAGVFDYYVLSLSWSPTWCALEGKARNSPQCDRPLGWVLHGLWPQYTRGYPSYCDSSARPPSRKETAAMADIMGTAGLAWYQWKKHGACAGLSSQDYFALARRAYEAVTRPEVLRRLDAPVSLPAEVIEEAFLQANPGWEPDMLTITCQSGRIQEARLCLSKALEPVPCGQDVVKDCRLPNALLDPVR